MEVSIAAQPVIAFGGLLFSNSFLSALVVSFLLLLLTWRVRTVLTAIPGRLQVAVEMLLEAFLKSAEDITGNTVLARQILPFVLTLFLFILVSNFSGLIPGVGSLHFHDQPLFRAPTSDLNLVIFLALVTVGYVQFLGIKQLGTKSYLSKFFTVRSPLDFFVGIQEFVSEITRIISFSFRLFGNIFAGEVMVGVVLYLTSTFLPYVAILPLPFYALEIFVGCIQAFVFSFLAIIFISLAITSHQHSEVAVA